MDLFAQGVVNGVTLGAVYALVGLGFVIIYKTTRMLNFAHGQILMVGAVIGLFVTTTWGWSYWPTFAFVVLVTAAIGVAVEKIGYRAVVDAPVATVILAAAALGTIMQSAVRITQGQQLSYFPPVVSTAPIGIGGIFVTPLQMVIVGICLVLVIGLWLLFQRTRLGLAMRAVSENRDAAALVGINAGFVSSLTWGLSGALAGAAGLLIAPLVLVTPDMGVIANTAFVGAVLGGFSSIPASVIGGVVLGVIETLVGLYLSTAYRDVVVFAILIAVLWFRPSGLFGRSPVRRV
jgi:branched-chain amino acid transport system permease protein